MTLPSATAAERALLGGLLQEPEHLDLVSLRPDQLHLPDHQRLFEVLRSMRADGIAIDLVTVGERLAEEGAAEACGGVGYVMRLPEHCPSTANLPHYAEVIAERAQERALVALGRDLVAGGVALTEASQRLDEIAGGGGVGGLAPRAEVTDDALARMEALAWGEETGRMRTGLLSLDAQLKEMAPTKLVVLAGRPGMGKSAIAQQIWDWVADEYGPVAVCSLEMGAADLESRALIRTSGVTERMLTMASRDSQRRGLLTRLAKAKRHLDKLPVAINDRAAQTIEDVRRHALRVRSHYGSLRLVVVDYLQIAGLPQSERRDLAVGAFSMAMKDLAKQLDCCVLLLSQLSRRLESRQDKRPLMSDLRDSGSIEQDADAVVMVYRESVYDPGAQDTIELIVRKQRNGGPGAVTLRWDGPTMSASEWGDRGLDDL